MISYSLIPLVAIFIYLLLVTLVLRDQKKRTHRLLLIYLVASIAWGLNGFLALADFYPGQLWLWGGLLPITGLWAVVSYFHLVGSFTQRNIKSWLIGAYLILLILAIITITGYAPQVLQRSDAGEVRIEYGPWLYLTLLGGAIFIGLSVYHLLQMYRTQENPLTQNKIIHFMLGAALLAFFSLRAFLPPVQEYPLEHLGNLFNVVLITQVTFGRKLSDLRLAFKKYFAYLSVSTAAAIFYVFVFWALHHSINAWTTPVSSAILGIAFVTTLLLYPLIMFLQKFMDKFYYGKGYDYRQMMADLGQKAKHILDLRELAEAMLKPIVNATNTMQASLLLSNDGHFTSQFAMRQIEGERVIPIMLDKDSQIVRRLATRDEPLTREVIEGALEFRRICEPDRNAVKAAEVELLLPIKSKNRLIGILALSKRQWGGFYSDDDIHLLEKLVAEAAPALENAQLYAEARDRAHVDQLTGLLNHGFFHERLDEEISRCSRFGDVFSVIFMDLDFFKTYNDAHGHLAGDEVLKQIAQCIRRSTRGMDIAFRYGGDEFAIILPQAPLDDAYKVAERIRRSVENEMDAKGIALTCSMGLASWPTDGVMREDILRAADAALYHSKKLGRNRISMAPEVVSSQSTEAAPDQEGESAILSTIQALAATVDAKDHSTYGHSAKTSKYATQLAKALGYSEDGIARIQAAALLHDIGKIRVSDTLLAKRGPLSDEDWEPIREHPKLGVSILKHVKGLNGCLAAIRYHHEHYDGSGYPAGLKGEEIPLDARILAVADAYDAMTSPRPYRDDKSTHDEAIEELKRCAGTHFDPEIVRVFAALWEPLKLTEVKRELAARSVRP
jgi:diguanylate cyclase (GGDEF)-like protein/putative nucleotidyltransferase with HDIG domain